MCLDGLDCYLSLNYVPAPWTLVEGIEKLLPGHWMEWRSGLVHTESYWQLPEQRPGGWTAETAQTELDRLLRESVREHMQSDVPLGFWLSGGLDSSSLVHYAAQESGARLKTFSITFRGRSFDEGSYVRQVSEHYGTEHTELDLNPELDLEAAVHELTYFCDEPNADSGALPVWFLSRMTRASATVALSGEGADELFAGYLTQRASALASRARRLSPPVLRMLLEALKRLPVSNDKIGFEYKAKRFLEGSLLPPAAAHVYWGGTFSEPAKRSIVQMALPGALDGILNELARGGDNLRARLLFDQKYYLSDDILTKVDHARGIRLRCVRRFSTTGSWNLPTPCPMR